MFLPIVTAFKITTLTPNQTLSSIIKAGGSQDLASSKCQSESVIIAFAPNFTINSLHIINYK
jgi:hypothetical protein